MVRVLGRNSCLSYDLGLSGVRLNDRRSAMGQRRGHGCKRKENILRSITGGAECVGAGGKEGNRRRSETRVSGVGISGRKGHGTWRVCSVDDVVEKPIALEEKSPLSGEWSNTFHGSAERYKLPIAMWSESQVPHVQRCVRGVYSVGCMSSSYPTVRNSIPFEHTPHTESRDSD